MITIAVKLLLLAFGIFAQNSESSAVITIAAVLSALTLTALNQYFGLKRFIAASSAVYLIISVFYPEFTPFIPLFCCDLISVKLRAAAALAFVPVITQWAIREPVDTAFLILLILLAVFLQYICEKIAVLSEENKRIRDDSTEFNRMLTEKNRNLIEKQNYEIHLVTLRERNRIAREIHDNVGHILSRSLLQTGALQAMNKDELLSGHLSGLKETLSLAMDSIRTSVHGLRDESVDLYESIRKMTERLNYEINIDYDVTQDLPNDVKYCFLAVLKEALTNIARHSDADCIRISVQEHPAIYQLFIHDNGTKKPSANSDGNYGNDGNDGMGLANMEERVSAFNGRFSASYRSGFRIFISIPKQSGTGGYSDENNNN